jgi:hypothetical protein
MAANQDPSTLLSAFLVDPPFVALGAVPFATVTTTTVLLLKNKLTRLSAIFLGIFARNC